MLGMFPSVFINFTLIVICCCTFILHLPCRSTLINCQFPNFSFPIGLLMTFLMTSPFLWLFAISVFCPLFSQSISWNEKSREIPLDTYPSNVSNVSVFCPLSSHYTWINIWMKRIYSDAFEMILICVFPLNNPHVSSHSCYSSFSCSLRWKVLQLPSEE